MGGESRVPHFGGKTSGKLFTLLASHLFYRFHLNKARGEKDKGKSATTNRARAKGLSFLLAMKAAPHHLNSSKKLVSGVRKIQSTYTLCSVLLFKRSLAQRTSAPRVSFPRRI